MSTHTPNVQDRRTGKDRRQEEQGPPSGYERRRSVEPRKPEVTELDLSEDELRQLGFLGDTSSEGSGS